MLKKKKKIIVKHPALRALRFNLRIILLNNFYDQEATLKALWLGVEKDSKLSLLRKLEGFRRAFRDSIVVCGLCSKLDGERIYFPKHKCWYCLDCFRKNLIPSLKEINNL